MKSKKRQRELPSTYTSGRGKHTYAEVSEHADFDGAHFHCGFCGDSIFFAGETEDGSRTFPYCPTCNKKPTPAFLRKHWKPPVCELRVGGKLVPLEDNDAAGVAELAKLV